MSLDSPTPSRAFGLVLAGGASSRFGTDKRLALFAGQSLLDRAVETMRTVVGSQLFVGAGERDLPAELEPYRIPDARTGCGPLAAVVAGLQRAHGPLLVLACDAPLVRARTLRSLLCATEDSGRVAALWVEPRWEPLIACYPAAALRHLSAALREDSLAMHPLLDELGAIAVPVPDPGEVLNANRPSDLQRIVEVAGRQDSNC